MPLNLHYENTPAAVEKLSPCSANQEQGTMSVEQPSNFSSSARSEGSLNPPTTRNPFLGTNNLKLVQGGGSGLQRTTHCAHQQVFISTHTGGHSTPATGSSVPDSGRMKDLYDPGRVYHQPGCPHQGHPVQGVISEPSTGCSHRTLLKSRICMTLAGCTTNQGVTINGTLYRMDQACPV